MADISPSNPVINIIDSPYSSYLLELSTLTVANRLNMGGNMKLSPLELEFVVLFSKDNCPIVRLGLVDARRIILLPFPKAASSTNPKEEDRVAFMLEIYWIGNGIRSISTYPNW